jgi:hypothetical protein
MLSTKRTTPHAEKGFEKGFVVISVTSSRAGAAALAAESVVDLTE